jgi:threonine dehydrogenase-like Zn-dependent dehydrogenase
MVDEVWEDFASMQVVTAMEQTHSYHVTAPNVPGAARYPTTLGYNNVSEVVAVGDEVESITVGDRVVSIASHVDTFDLVEWQATRVPDEIPDEAAAFGYIATLGLVALRRVAFSPGEKVGVIGLGLVGLTSAMVADAFGARPICFDIDANRRQLAKAALRGSVVLDPNDADVGPTLEETLAPHGMDIVIEAAGGAAALDFALRIIDDHGRVAVVALHPEEVGPLLSSNFYLKQVAILGSAGNPFRSPHDRRDRFTVNSNIAEVLELARRGRLPLQRIHTDTYRATEIQDAYRELAHGRGEMVGVLLDWRAQ